jgi:teneurin
VICCWQVLRERLRISGTNVHLVHDSSDTPGFQSALFIALTLNSVPESLFLVRLRIVVEGVVFEKDFEADIRLQYRFAWDRRNAYNQKVYGVATATGLHCLQVSLSH